MNIYKKREGRYPSKKNCRNCLLSEKHIHNSSKKQKDNEIQHHKTVGTQDAEPRKWDKMNQFTPLKGIKRHA